MPIYHANEEDAERIRTSAQDRGKGGWQDLCYRLHMGELNTEQEWFRIYKTPKGNYVLHDGKAWFSGTSLEILSCIIEMMRGNEHGKNNPV